MMSMYARAFERRFLIGNFLHCRCASAASDAPRVLVTGGAKGIGLGIVNAFLANNAQVAYADIEESDGSPLGFAQDTAHPNPNPYPDADPDSTPNPNPDAN